MAHVVDVDQWRASSLPHVVALVCPSVCMSVCLSVVCLSLYLPVYLFILSLPRSFISISSPPPPPPLQGLSVSQAAVRVRQVFWTALKMNWKVWTVAQYVNFAYVPQQVITSFLAS